MHDVAPGAMGNEDARENAVGYRGCFAALRMTAKTNNGRNKQRSETNATGTNNAAWGFLLGTEAPRSGMLRVIGVIAGVVASARRGWA